MHLDAPTKTVKLCLKKCGRFYVMHMAFMPADAFVTQYKSGDGHKQVKEAIEKSLVESKEVVVKPFIPTSAGAVHGDIDTVERKFSICSAVEYLHCFKRI